MQVLLHRPSEGSAGQEKVGRLDLFCVLTDPSQKAQMKECTFTTSKADAITGGTHEYAGVRGEVRFTFRANKVISTFHFVD